MIKYLPFILIFNSMADEIELRQLSLEFTRAVGTNRHWSIPSGEIKKGSLALDMGIGYKSFYTQTRVDTFYTDRQFRYVALDYEMGYKYNKFDIYVQHKSEHALDKKFDSSYLDKYPNQNSVGFRINLLGR